MTQQALKPAISRPHKPLNNNKMKPSYYTYPILRNREKQIKKMHTNNKEQIIERVCNYYEIKFEDLTKKSRRMEVCFPRQLIMFLLKQKTNLSLRQIGETFGGRDHTTAIHSIRVIENYLETNSKNKRDEIMSFY